MTPLAADLSEVTPALMNVSLNVYLRNQLKRKLLNTSLAKRVDATTMQVSYFWNLPLQNKVIPITLFQRLADAAAE